MWYRCPPDLILKGLGGYFAIVAFALASLPAHADFTGKVVAVADGDTITVLRDKKQVKIRLAGIDAPEKAQAFGNKSKQHMSDMVFGKDVRVDDRTKDKYWRLRALLWHPANCSHSVAIPLVDLRHGVAICRIMPMDWKARKRGGSQVAHIEVQIIGS